jgi:fluoride exporter
VITALLVVVCGGAGAIARFTVDEFVSERTGGSFPVGTLLVNLSGCFLLGLLVGLDPGHRTAEILGTATLGSYTTFSTWMLETHRAAQDGDWSRAWQGIVVALVAGLAIAALGRVVGGWL